MGNSNSFSAFLLSRLPLSFYILPCALFFLLLPAHCVARQLEDALSATGAEGVSDKSGIVELEYRQHRNPVSALKLDSSDIKASGWLFRYQGIPISYLGEPSEMSIQPASLLPEGYRADLSFTPLYYAEYGDFREPFRTQLAIAPQLEILLLRGLVIDFQWVVPFQNDFKRRAGYNVRPGNVGISFLSSWKLRHFLKVKLGSFTNFRYGAMAEFLNWNRNYRWLSGISLYSTSNYLYVKNVLYREKAMEFTGSIFTSYRLKRYHITLRLALEQYLYSDTGTRFDFIRQFGNTDVGFYLTQSVNGSNGGFYFTIPLVPKRFYQNRWLQVRPANEWTFSYELRPGTQIGTDFDDFTSFERKLRSYNPLFLEDQLRVEQ